MRSFIYRRAACAVASILWPVASQAATFGDWHTGSTDGGYLYAASANGSGSLFMLGCSPTGCSWYLAASTSCEPNTSSPALLSTAAGAFPITLVCEGPMLVGKKRLFRNKLAESNELDSALMRSPQIGLAAALLDGRFGVYRFSMTGARQAIADMTRAANKLKRANLRDSAM